MLDGTPLGRWALERLQPKKLDAEPDEGAEGEHSQGEEAPEAEAAPTEPQPTVDDARRMGAEAARNGEPVTSNPFPARDERRAAWDEAWCRELGSDGMEIPPALRPTPKPKKGEEPGEGKPE
jgi:hypothetical protein